MDLKNATFDDNDIFLLEPFAENLRFLFNSPTPLTIIIDGSWGTGKTVFATQLDNMMGGRSDYINVFAHDYQDDVFTTLLLSVKQAVDPDKKFEEPFIDLLLHHIAPNLLNELANKWIGIDIKKLFSSDTKKSAQTYIENVKERQEMLDNFRIALEQHMKEKEPMVIIVDELDRCKPKYALQVLEIIKHLYSVPNLHFALIMNAKQIIKTIRHEHGCDEEDAKIYLQKFYDLIVPLPGIGYSLSDSENISKDTVENYINFNFNKTDKVVKNGKLKNRDSRFDAGFVDLAYGHQLSLREIDKIFLLLNIIDSYPPENYFRIDILAILLLIWLRKPDLFTRIIKHYGIPDRHVVPDSSINADIRSFLQIEYIQSRSLQDYWADVLPGVWNPKNLPENHPEYIPTFIAHVRHLAFLTPFIPPENKTNTSA